jgi:hypothetical protein
MVNELKFILTRHGAWGVEKGEGKKAGAWSMDLKLND